MQGIRFSEPVAPEWLAKGTYLRRYGRPGETRGTAPRGAWYTSRDVPARLLALPPEQTAPHGYEVLSPVEVLASKAADILVDWGMRVPKGKKPVMDVDYHYRAGGGTQYVLPNAPRVLRTL
jgi:hypothetical protein